MDPPADATTCPECGTPLPPGRTCRDEFHEMLAVESHVPFAPGGEPHFFAVASYNLQHPSGFVPAMLIGLQRTLADVLAARATIADARRRAGEGAAGAARVRRDASTPLAPAEAALRDAWPTRWPLTVRHVIEGGPSEYVARVRELAESVVATLGPAVADVGRTVKATPPPPAR